MSFSCDAHADVCQTECLAGEIRSRPPNANNDNRRIGDLVKPRGTGDWQFWRADLVPHLVPNLEFRAGDEVGD